MLVLVRLSVSINFGIYETKVVQFADRYSKERGKMKHNPPEGDP
jgi:hypothetical protein